VSGIKTECSAGAGKMQCMNVHRGENLENAEWENFYSQIENFEFEAGYLKKIKVKEEKKEKVPADASSVQYTLIKELVKQPDKRTQIKGNWRLAGLNNHPINKKASLPDLEIRLSEMRINGYSGCNNYSGTIQQLTQDSIRFGPIMSTKKACLNDNVEPEYYEAVNSVATYIVEEGRLNFYHQHGEKVLSFLKSNEADKRLHDIWNATQIFGEPVTRKNSIPRLEINLTKMKVYGSDGCNNYTGSITKVTGETLEFGNLASTRKMCPDMQVPDQYLKAINQVAGYRLKGLNLILLDSNGDANEGFTLSEALIVYN
jgi:heat shock protein HslJ